MTGAQSSGREQDGHQLSARYEVVPGLVSQGQGGGWNCGSGPLRSQNSTVVPPKIRAHRVPVPPCASPGSTSCPLSDPSPLSA